MAITDVPGVLVGQHQRIDADWATGTTVVLTPQGAAAAVDVRGGGPGTRETDVLAPGHLVRQAHAVVLTGGSAYGLASADGVMRWLGEHGHGLPIGGPGEVVPIVPAAVLYDLPMSRWQHWPDAEFGYLACENARSERPDEGNVGAGAGAVSGALKGGVGTASAHLPDGTTVGALLAVNSSGSVVNPETGLPWEKPASVALRTPAAAEVREVAEQAPRPARHGSGARPLNTTIGVVATDLPLSKSECQRLAVAAQDGLARAVRPAHGMFDGDTVFALATGQAPMPEPGTLDRVRALDAACAVAADVVAHAIVRGVLTADTLDAAPSYASRCPSAFPATS